MRTPACILFIYLFIYFIWLLSFSFCFLTNFADLCVCVSVCVFEFLKALVPLCGCSQVCVCESLDVCTHSLQLGPAGSATQGTPGIMD